MVRMEQRDLADRAKVSTPTIRRLEAGSGPLKATYENVSNLQSALESAGVTFTEYGVELRPPTEQ